MSKKDLRYRKNLSAIKKLAVSALMSVWLIASSFLAFVYMAERFFPEHVLLVIVLLCMALTGITFHYIRRIELMMTYIYQAE
jgi:hypothetical protein